MEQVFLEMEVDETRTHYVETRTSQDSRGDPTDHLVTLFKVNPLEFFLFNCKNTL